MDKNRVTDLAKQWITIDREMVKLRGHLRERRKRQRAISAELWTFANRTNTKCITSTENSGALNFKKRVERKGITLKSVRAILLQFHQGDQELVDKQTKFIQEKRDVVTRETIEFKNFAIAAPASQP